MPDQLDRFPKEKRRSPRISGAVVEYTIGENQALSKKAFIKDICVHGICVYMPEVMDHDAKINMDIFLFGNETPIHAEGKVVWYTKGEYLGHHNVGIEFQKISKKDKKTLSDHIKANLPAAEGGE